MAAKMENPFQDLSWVYLRKTDGCLGLPTFYLCHFNVLADPYLASLLYCTLLLYCTVWIPLFQLQVPYGSQNKPTENSKKDTLLYIFCTIGPLSRWTTHDYNVPC